MATSNITIWETEITPDKNGLYKNLSTCYKLRFVFSIEGQKLGVFMNDNYWDIAADTIYWVSVINDYDSKNRNIYCFDFCDLVDGTILLDTQDKKLFVSLKRAFNKRFMTFKTVNEAYLFEQIYENI